jgi:hypothetical protein
MILAMTADQSYSLTVGETFAGLECTPVCYAQQSSTYLYCGFGLTLQIEAVLLFICYVAMFVGILCSRYSHKCKKALFWLAVFTGSLFVIQSFYFLLEDHCYLYYYLGRASFVSSVSGSYGAGNYKYYAVSIILLGFGISLTMLLDYTFETDAMKSYNSIIHNNQILETPFIIPEKEDKSKLEKEIKKLKKSLTKRKYDNKTIGLIITDLKGEAVTVEVLTSSNVLILKEHVRLALKIVPVTKFSLMYEEKILINDQIVNEIGFSNGSIVQILYSYV